MQNQTRRAIIFKNTNKAFLVLDNIIVMFCIISIFISIPDICQTMSQLIYLFLYLMQTIQHYFIYIFPKIDINRHFVAYRRTVISICLTDMAYMLMCITFWQKTNQHPIYCLLCGQWRFGAWIGILLVLHCIFLIGWAVTLIQAYVQRRYYLLALGGYEVQQQLIRQRQNQLQQMMIIQPYINTYPFSQNSRNKDKYYKFEDVYQTAQQNFQCSICLNNKIEDDHFVDAGCGHFYHQICLLQWAQVNQNCPQCRAHFIENGNKQKQNNLQANEKIQEEEQQEQEQQVQKKLQTSKIDQINNQLKNIDEKGKQILLSQKQQNFMSQNKSSS